MERSRSLAGRITRARYDYFREHICGKKDGKQREFRSGISEMNGSSEVVEMFQDPDGLGYSGMGYKTANGELVEVSSKKENPASSRASTVARSGKYPSPKALHLHRWPTHRRSQGYIDWILSPAGRRSSRPKASCVH